MAGIDFVNHLTRDAVEHFGATPQVEAVYRNVCDDSVYFYVFTSNQTYDEQLLRRLIGIELDLSRKYPETDHHYRFVASCLVDDHAYVTGGDAYRVWALESA